VPHRRWISNPLVLIADLLTVEVVRFFRIGPWYCVHCDSRKVLLPLRKANAVDYRSAALQNETPPANPRRKSEPLAKPASPAATTAAEKPTLAPTAPPPVPAQLEPAESVGNFIKTESSLLMKSTYRDAVVRRIFSGATTIKQIREEKQLSESEITDWIADLFSRQQQKIDALEQFKNSITGAMQLETQSFRNSRSESETVSGQVRPR